MTFIHHNFLGDIELEKKDTPGCRLYQLPDGNWVPSITSVTSFYIGIFSLSGERELALRRRTVLRRKQPRVVLISMKRPKRI